MEVTGILPETGNPHHKIISLAAGEAHTLALSADGKVYTWGRGMFGRLGNGSESDEFFPVPVRFDSGEGKPLKFVAVAAGAYHSLALSDDGSVWCWGYNIYGQLGFSSDSFESSSVPRLLERFLGLGSHDALTDEVEEESKTPLKIHTVKAGGMMSLAIDKLGGLWMWGNCPHQNRTNGENFALVSSSVPHPVWQFHGHTVVKVACGNEHVVALVTVGETQVGGNLVCYSWGSNTHGQLGLGDTESRSTPEVVETFNSESPWVVDEVACGAFHTALISHRKSPSHVLESICWTFGLGDNGQLGHGSTKSALLPEPVKGFPEHVFLISVDCGLFHTSAVTSTGEVWSWGMEKGLGLCPDANFTGDDAGDAILPRVYGPRFPGPVQVACGAAHTVLVASDGYKLWSWGRGRSGVLGTGMMADCFAPSKVLWPPLEEDFEVEQEKAESKEANTEDKEPGVAEMEKKLSSAMNELKLLQSRFSLMERYASILHGSIFGKPLEEQDIPVSMQSAGYFDVAKVWENMLESADHGKLARMEAFYRNLLAGVKDKLMKRRIQEIVEEFLRSSTMGNK